jgi:methanogenic corrinoid protein MtbC1
MSDPTARLLGAYLATLDPPDLTAARRLANRALDQGMAPAAFIEQILVPAQEEVGRRWQSNECTVPQEHAATVVADTVLATVSARTPGDNHMPGRIVSCCVEGEWHTLPLRLVSDSLVMRGHDVVFLGPSVPASQLAGFLRTIDALALIASCTTATNLPGARRTIEAAHDAGVPVILGGRALGANRTRADHLGADGWGSTAADADAVLADWADLAPALAQASAVEPEVEELENPRAALVQECLDVLLDRRPALRAMTDAQIDRTREDLSYAMQFCAAALVCDDPTVLDEYTVWLRDLLAARAVPPSAIRAGYEAIAEVLGAGFPETLGMLAASSALL